MSWQKILAQGFASSSELLQYLGLPIQASSTDAEKLFRTRVPRGFAARMQHGNPRDPLLLQVLAAEQELIDIAGYTKDPLHEKETNPLDGLLHKYKGRVLLTLTGACAVHCRYCFRRHFPYQQNNPGREGWTRVLEYIRQDNSIYEVILSGGDPLLAADVVLEELFYELSKMHHVHIVRFHTRIPIVLPERINASLLALLEQQLIKKVLVLHCNHPQELNQQVANICAELKQAGCTLLNQAVLLKDVNDHVDTLSLLSQRLFQCGVLPYYLHVLDKVAGAAHFDLPFERASALFQQLQESLPGYLVPRLAREDAGKKNKTLLF